MEAAQASVDSDSVDVLKTLIVSRAYKILKASTPKALAKNAFSEHFGDFLPGCEPN